MWWTQSRHTHKFIYLYIYQISSEVKLLFGKVIHSLDPESIYGSTSSGLSGNLRKTSNLRVDSLTESNENTGTSESEDYLNDNGKIVVKFKTKKTKTKWWLDWQFEWMLWIFKF